jgi:protein-disulfide isomerase
MIRGELKAMRENVRFRILLLLSLIGLVVSAVSGLAEHVQWLQALCANVSEGCKDAAVITFMRLPIWVWGVVLYAALSLSVLFYRRPFLWLVYAAVGVEMTLIWTLFRMEAPCIFCIANAVVLLIIAVVAFERARLWQSMSLALLLLIFSLLWIANENRLPLVAAAPTAKQPSEKEIAARVGDEVITMDMLLKPILPRVNELEKELYKIKQEQLRSMIMEILMRKEAAARGMDLEKFMSSVILKDVKVTEAEIEQYYSENMDRIDNWQGTTEELKSRVVQFLENQKKYKEVMNYAKSIEAKYGVEVYLKSPDQPRVSVKTQGNYSVGPADAPVTVVEFSDYQCPACRGAHGVVKQVRDLYKGRIRWVFKDYPLQRHKDARRAAEAARCAGDQGKFWEYQDVLYGSEVELTVEYLTELAGKLGLNSDVFKQCLESGKHKDVVEKDVQESREVGVDRTPMFIINGMLVSGPLTVERFSELIDEELRAAGKKP